MHRIGECKFASAINFNRSPTDMVKVKVLDIEKGNRIRLSMKAAADEGETVASGAGAEGADD